MEIQEYISKAVETESIIDVVEVDVASLTQVLTLLIAAGNLLDVIKKDTFYGPPKDATKEAERTSKIAKAINELTHSNLSVINNDSAPRTQITHINPRLFHGLVGKTTESVELMEALLHSIQTGEPIDRTNILEEVGDGNWYDAIIIDVLGGNWPQIMETNIRKLMKRFKKNKFDSTDATNRDLTTERELLENDFKSDR